MRTSVPLFVCPWTTFSVHLCTEDSKENSSKHHSLNFQYFYPRFSAQWELKKNRKNQFGYNYELHCKTANYSRASIPCFVESSAIHICTAHKLACINNDIRTLLMLWPHTQCLMPVMHTQSYREMRGCTPQALIAAHVLVSNIIMSPISWA